MSGPNSAAGLDRCHTSGSNTWSCEGALSADRMRVCDKSHHGAQVRQIEQRVWNPAAMRRPPPVPTAVQLRHDQRAAERLRKRKRVADLLDLVVHECKVAVLGVGRVQQRTGHVSVEDQKPARRIVVRRRIHVPKHGLAHAVPFAIGTRKLEGGVNDVRLQLELLVHPLHEKRVATSERRDRQDAHAKRALRGKQRKLRGRRGRARRSTRTSYAIKSRLGSSLPTPLRNRSLNAFWSHIFSSLSRTLFHSSTKGSAALRTNMIPMFAAPKPK